MRQQPNLILQQGKPKAVILDIAAYEALLERAEEAEDLREIRSMKKRGFRLRPPFSSQ